MNKPLRVLVLDNNREEKSFGSHDLVRWVLKTTPPGSEVMVRRPPDQDLPSQDLEYDALVISGSITSCLETKEPWIKPYDDYVTAQIQNNKPIFGVCYGHQTLARCIFRLNGMEVKLGTAKDAELGWQTIDRHIENGESEIFAGMAQKFVTYQSHYEEVTELPPGTKCLASTDRCAIQAFELVGKPVFGVQFHPEYSVEEAEASLAEKLKKGIRKDWILNPGKGHKLYDDTVGTSIFGNFFRIADQHRNK